MKTIVILFLYVLGATAQTTVNGGSQIRWIDFANQTFARPWPVKSALPANCRVGEALFLDNPQVGRHLYLCMQTNLWTQIPSTGQTSPGSAGQTADLSDLLVEKTADNQIRIGASCTPAKPCRATLGFKSIIITSTATVTLSGTLGTGNLLIWVAEDGIRVGHNTTATAACNSSCGVVAGQVASIPAFMIPIASVPFNSNVFADLIPANDRRSLFLAPRFESGASGNLVVYNNGSNGASSFDLSSTLDFGGFSATRVTKRGTAAQRPSTCAQGELYYQSETSVGLYYCSITNLWTGPLSSMESGSSGMLTSATNGANGNLRLDLNSAFDLGAFTSTRPVKRGSSSQRPLNCTQSELYYQTDQNPGLYHCSAADLWTGPVSTLEVGTSGALTVSTNSLNGNQRLDLNQSLDLGSLTSTRVTKRGIAATRPPTCAQGELFYQTDSSAGLYHCSLTNIWSGPLGIEPTRWSFAGMTGVASTSTILAAGHGLGNYRVCFAATIRTMAATGSLDLSLEWKNADLAAASTKVVVGGIALNAADEYQGCRVVRSDGSISIRLRTSSVGTAVFDVYGSLERL